MSNVSKKVLASRVYYRIGNVSTVSQEDLLLIIRTLFEEMGKSLIEGHRIELRGFGNFRTYVRKAGVYRNPRLGTLNVKKPARVKARFIPSEILEDQLNETSKY